ncbi:MAG: hypothetical protein ACREM6_06100 [Vulcanimicrobiaceae bacterium]
MRYSIGSIVLAGAFLVAGFPGAAQADGVMLGIPGIAGVHIGGDGIFAGGPHVAGVHVGGGGVQAGALGIAGARVGAGGIFAGVPGVAGAHVGAGGIDAGALGISGVRAGVGGIFVGTPGASVRAGNYIPGNLLAVSHDDAVVQLGNGSIEAFHVSSGQARILRGKIGSRVAFGPRVQRRLVFKESRR